MKNNEIKWEEVEKIKDSLGENKLPATDQLAGQGFTFYFLNDGLVMHYEISGKHTLTWNTLHGLNAGESGEEHYEAVCVAPGIFLITYSKREDPLVSVSIAMDLESGRATFLIGSMPKLEDTYTDLIARMKQDLDLSPVKVKFLHANVNPDSTDKPVIPHERTSDLVGKRIKYTYGDEGVYEHIYLSELFFTWHCLSGPEKGLADTERCDYISISPEVYLFSWREKTVPTLGVVLVNVNEMHSNGMLFGIDTDTGEPIHFNVGAKCQLLNITSY
jgi:hypothetical protein